MKKKLALKYRAIMSIVCSLILFCLPIGAYMANDTHTMSVFASSTVTGNHATDDTTGAEVEKTAGTSGGDQQTSNDNTKAEDSKTGADTEQAGGTDQTTGENQTEQPTEEVKEPECTCTEKCTQYAVNRECEHCKTDYTKCKYINPNVVITIKTPDGWYNDNAKVRVSVEDKLKTGNFVVATIEAKIGQSGSWTDITDDRVIEISENCSIYVRVTDQNGKEYERNRAMKCFDRTKPTLNAAVNDGSLSVQASDTDSGVKAIYVNGYEFKELTNGTLNIRLQQFDSGYQYFTIQALDHAGNLSEVYKTQNPYYKDPAKEDDSSGNNSSASLPVNAQATAPSSATANVTEHMKTDSNGNTITGNNETESTQNLSPAEQKKKAMAEADAAEQGEENTESEQGKEFYTIQTASEKVFYLIIDRDGEDEKVYFLTEISENDLLNTVDTTSDTLPMNSAALDNGIPTESALPNNNVEVSENTAESAIGETTEDVEEPEEETEEEPVKEKKPIKESTFGTYILFGVLGAGVIATAYFLKIKKKKEDFLDEDDDTEEEEETFENEDEESDEVDDFFDQEVAEESDNDSKPQTSEEDVTETIDDAEEEED